MAPDIISYSVFIYSWPESLTLRIKKSIHCFFDFSCKILIRWLHEKYEIMHETNTKICCDKNTRAIFNTFVSTSAKQSFRN